MKRILILENDESLLKLYTLGLKYAGYQVTGVSSMEQLQSTLRQGSYDLLISDLHVGQVTSEFVVHALAQIRRDMRLPVLVVTGNATPHLPHLHHLEIPYLQKPFVNSVLVETVAALIEGTPIKQY